jgi:hypothetical protein
MGETAGLSAKKRDFVEMKQKSPLSIADVALSILHFASNPKRKIHEVR